LPDCVLIASLGRAPPVVTETVDALLELGVNLKRVYCVSTADDVICTKCIPLLLNEFEKYPEYKRRRIEFYPWNLISNRDIETIEDHLEFLRVASSIMKEEEGRGSEIYLSMAGGRKTMSAAMAVLAQVYSAKAITHVLVPPEIEEKGTIAKLEQIEAEEERKRVLHPPEKNLILFPVIGIASFRDEMIRILKQEGGPYDKKVKEFLKTNNYLDANEKPTSSGKNFLILLEDIKDTPSVSTRKPEEKPKLTHPPISKDQQTFVLRLAQNPHVELIEDVKHVNSPETRINRIEDTMIIAQYSNGNKAVVLRIYTTGRTRSQVEKIREELSRLFEPKKRRK